MFIRLESIDVMQKIMGTSYLIIEGVLKRFRIVCRYHLPERSVSDAHDAIAYRSRCIPESSSRVYCNVSILQRRPHNVFWKIYSRTSNFLALFFHFLTLEIVHKIIKTRSLDFYELRDEN